MCCNPARKAISLFYHAFTIPQCFSKYLKKNDLILYKKQDSLNSNTVVPKSIHICCVSLVITSSGHLFDLFSDDGKNVTVSCLSRLVNKKSKFVHMIVDKSVTCCPLFHNLSHEKCHEKLFEIVTKMSQI